jgi:hypothetical protein
MPAYLGNVSIGEAKLSFAGAGTAAYVGGSLIVEKPFPRNLSIPSTSFFTNLTRGYIKGSITASPASSANRYYWYRIYNNGTQEELPSYSTNIVTITGLTKEVDAGFGYIGYTWLPGATSVPSTGAFTPNWSGDQYFYQVGLLLNGQSLIDQSRFGRTITAYSGASASTAQSRFGGGSLSLSATSAYFTVPVSGGALPMEGDFAISWWQYLTGDAGSIISNATVGGAFGNYFRLGFNAQGAGTLSVGYDGCVFSSVPQTKNSWTHYAVSRSGDTNRLYVNGLLHSTVQDGTPHVMNTEVRLGAGAFSPSTVGYIDGLRWTCGTARGHTGATLPTFETDQEPPTTQLLGDIAVVLTGGTQFTAPLSGTVKAFAIGGGGIGQPDTSYGGAGALCYKTWNVSQGDVINYSVGVGGNGNITYYGRPTTVTFNGQTITAGGGCSGSLNSSGQTQAGGGFSGGDGGVNGGDGAGTYSAGGKGGAVTGLTTTASPCGRLVMRASVDLDLIDTLQLAGYRTTEACDTVGVFGSGAAGDGDSAEWRAGIGGGGLLSPTSLRPGNGAVVLLFKNPGF